MLETEQVGRRIFGGWGACGVAAAYLASVLAIGLLPAQNAVAAPTPAQVATPWSWPQFKEGYGLSILDPAISGSIFSIASPSTPTNLYDWVLGTNTTLGQQLESFVIGDVANTTMAYDEPPLGKNAFRDSVVNTGTSTKPTVVSWISPYYQLTASSGGGLDALDAVPGTNGIATDSFNLLPATTSWSQLIVGGSPGIPVGTNDYTGTGYYTATAVTRTGKAPASEGSAQAVWVLTAPSSGSYTVYQWCPSQNLTATQPEAHVTDAEYVVTAGGTSYVGHVDQTEGGSWVSVIGPISLTTGEQVTVTLDNTSATLTAGSSTVPVVVADAVEIQSDNGFVSSSPVSVNATNYPEVVNGYAGGSAAIGGLGAEYAAPTLAVTSGTGVTSSGDATPFSTQIHGAGKAVPIGQLVYFTRSENITNFLTAQSQTVGAVYCVDGLTGDVVWRYPNSTSSIVDDSQTTVYSGTSIVPFSTTGTWMTGATGPDTEYYGTSYAYTPAANRAAGAGAIATWNLNLPASTGTASYNLYAWVPLASGGSVHVSDAEYTVTDANGSHVVLVSQQGSGGAWVPINNPDNTNGTWFSFSSKTAPTLETVALDNTTLNSDSAGNTPPAGSVVDADAILAVPVDTPLSLSSSPVLVRNMSVLVDATTTPPTYAPRTVVVVGDSSGKLFCLDAAGNQDGNDTILDSKGLPVVFGANGTPTPADANYPYSIANVGTTKAYWVWQPDPTKPLEQNVVVDDNSDVTTAGETFSPVTSGSVFQTVNGSSSASGGWQNFLTTPGTQYFGIDYARDATVPTAATGAQIDSAVWTPFIDPTVFTAPTQFYAYVWVPVAGPGEVYAPDAAFTVTDSSGISTPVTVNEQQDGGEWVPLGGVGNNIYSFGPSGSNPPAQSAPGAPNTISVTNVSADSGADGSGNTYYTAADAIALVPVVASGATKYTIAVDPTSNLVVPGDFGLNSATAVLRPTPGAASGTSYDATFFVGNTNGELYSIEGRGVVNNPVTTGLDLRTRDLSLDPTMPTVNVNWWFGTGSGIDYAPAYDRVHNLVFSTTYNPNDENQGRLYAVNASAGPWGNGGSGLPLPGSYHYNTNPIPTWSFPDAYGNVKPGWYKSNSADGNPALPLGDAAGSPVVFTQPVPGVTTGTDTTDIYFTANDPTNAQGGRVYAVKPNGVFDWVYPALPTATPDPNAFTGSTGTTTQATAYGDTTPMGGFTEHLADPDVFVSSSPAMGYITYPNVQPKDSASPPTYDYTANEHTTIPMLYVGDLNGNLTALRVDNPPPAAPSDVSPAETVDDERFIYQRPVDGSAIYSSPCLVPGSATAVTGKTLSPAGAGIGGVLFVTTSTGNIYEIEATPYTFDAAKYQADPSTYVPAETEAVYVGKDWGFGGPGGISSPSVASFDTRAFTASALTTYDNSEWVYAGGDDGFCYGFTANTSSGGGFTPSNFVPAGNVPPAAQTDLTRNFLTAVAYTCDDKSLDYEDAAIVKAGTTGTTQTAGAVAEWGDTMYIKIFGVDDPNASGLPDPYNQTHAKLLSLTFTVQARGPGNRAILLPNRTINLANAQPMTAPADTNTNYQLGAATNADETNGIAYITNGSPTDVTQNANDGNYPVFAPPVAASAITTASTYGPCVATFPYQLGASSPGNFQTPGTVIVTNVVERVQVNGQVETIIGGSDTGTLVNTGAGLGVTAPADQVQFEILNPLAVRGSGLGLDGATGHALAIYPAGTTLGSGTAHGSLGPFISVTPISTTSCTPPTWPSYQAADTVGNNIPTSAPIAGSGITNPVAPPSSTTTQVNRVLVNVAVDLGDLGHGNTGDSGTTNPSGALPNANGDDPIPPTSTGPGDFGSSMLNIADRSKLGTAGLAITNLRMTTPHLGWNDNSSAGGPGAVINPLPWDSMPTAYYVNNTPVSANQSPDYPDIPTGNITVNLQSRGNGASTTITSAGGTLTPHSATAASLPNAALVKVKVPKYQPANLEAFQINTIGTEATSAIGGTNHQALVNAGSSLGQYVPQGYVATARVYVDSAGNGRYIPGEAYRDIQVWVGVQVDQSMHMDSTTLDEGAVPAGFGLWYPSNATWNPFYNPAGLVNPLYTPEYKQFEIHNVGNVNMLNVHLDQMIGANNGSGGAVSALPPMAMSSDTNSIYAGIPFTDDANGDLSGTQANGTIPFPLVRTSFDYFDPTATISSSGWSDPLNTYLPNPAELSGSKLATPGPTLHKPRVGDDPTNGTVMTNPDEPRDASNPAYINVAALPFPHGNTVVGVAVPYGTPVGTYAQSIRAFEGSDPKSTISPYVGPTYGGTFFSLSNPTAAIGSPVLAFNSSGSPQQSYTEPGDVLKVSVTEGRMTDGSPMYVTAATSTGSAQVSSVLPYGDVSAAASNSDDFAPAIFRDPATLNMALIWSSARGASKSIPYTIEGSLLAGGGTSGKSSTGLIGISTPTATGTSWWTTPATLASLPTTDPTTSLPVRNFAPSVVPFATSTTTGTSTTTSTEALLWVSEAVPASTTSGTSTTVKSSAMPYTLNIAPLVLGGGTSPVDVSGMPTALVNSVAPVFGPVAVNLSTAVVPLPGLAVFWYTRNGSHASINYELCPVNGGVITAGKAYVLPTPAGLSAVSQPSAQIREVVVNGNPVIDVTYTGVSGITGESDIYTSRYMVQPMVGTTPSQLVLEPSPAQGVPIIEPLLRTAGNPGVFQSEDIGWQRAFNVTVGTTVVPTFELLYSTAGSTPPTPGNTVPSPLPAGTSVFVNPATTASTYDSNSGQWIFRGVTMPWDSVTNQDVYVNPSAGTVRFSDPPPSTDQGTISALAAPQAMRITYQSRTNAAPVVFIDNALKPNAGYLPSGQDGQYSANNNSSNQLPAVPAARYWYIWRKSGLTNPPGVESTLYYKTRRLTVQLPVSEPIEISSSGTGVTTLVGQVTVTDAYGNTVTPDVDFYRNRLYFPEVDSKGNSLEGQTVSVSWTWFNATLGSGGTAGPVAYTVLWQDESYSNDVSNSNIAGERAVPISNAVNELSPTAILDPVAGLSGSDGLIVGMHRVWLDWVSTRNASATNGTGADIYTEALDPNFTALIP
jgi:hypothetical protein